MDETGIERVKEGKGEGGGWVHIWALGHSAVIRKEVWKHFTERCTSAHTVSPYMPPGVEQLRQ